MCAKYSPFNWDDIRIFLAVARHGQILSASKALGLNHATVARRLSALETALGSKLLIRRTNGSDLSEEGQRFLLHAEKMESEMLVARQNVGAESAVEGTVRIGAPDGFGVAFLAPRLIELADRHKGLQLELVPVPRAFSLSRREADVAVTLERPREGRLIAGKLTDYHLRLYAARHYLERRGTPETIEQLAEHSLVGYVEDLLYTASLDYTGEFLKVWNSTVSVSSAMGQTAAVRSGAGIGILHTFMANGSPELVPVLSQRYLKRSYWTVVHEDLRAIGRIALVIDFINEIVARERAVFLA